MLVDVRDGEYVEENGLQALVPALGNGHVGLQKRIEGIYLDRQKIRHFDDGGQFGIIVACDLGIIHRLTTSFRQVGE